MRHDTIRIACYQRHKVSNVWDTLLKFQCNETRTHGLSLRDESCSDAAAFLCHPTHSSFRHKICSPEKCPIFYWSIKLNFMLLCMYQPKLITTTERQASISDMPTWRTIIVKHRMMASIMVVFDDNDNNKKFFQG